MELTLKHVIIVCVFILMSSCSPLMEESVPFSTEVCVVPKCCLPNQSIPASGKGCQNTSLRFAPNFWNAGKPTEFSESQLLDIIVGDPCQYGKFRLEPEEESSDEFHVLCNGSLLLPFHSVQLYAMNQYCLESFFSKNGVQEPITLPLLCFPPLPPFSFFHQIDNVLYAVGLIISVPFLVVTAVVFARVAELRNARGKSISCQCSSQAIACVSLATILLVGNSLTLSINVTLGFITQFVCMSCFIWLNVLCIDTWWRLTRKPSLSDGQERVRFVWYSLYAWSIPLVGAVVTVVKGLAPLVPGAYPEPTFERDSTFPYFYLLIGLLFLFDIGLLCMSVGYKRTAVQQRKAEELDLNIERSAYPCSKATSDIDMFMQCLILFLVMGLNWSLEMISYFVPGLVEVWILTITLNAFHGLIICIMFIFRAPQVRTLAAAKFVH